MLDYFFNDEETVLKKVKRRKNFMSYSISTGALKKLRKTPSGRTDKS